MLGVRRSSIEGRGFTLVELLVVVAIVAVLAAVMMPAGFPGHFFPKERARRTVCMMNLKQLAAAASMYAMDYDGRYPHAGLTCLDPAQPDGSPGCSTGALNRDSNRYGYTETWQGGGLQVMFPYYKNTSIVWCPSIDKGAGPTPTDPKSYYAACEWLERPVRVRYPEGKVLLLEAYSYHDDKRQRFDQPPNPRLSYNVAFVDGHVKAMDLSTGCSGNSHPSCAGWESCMGPGGNGNYLCSGYGKGVGVPDFSWLRVPSTGRGDSR